MPEWSYGGGSARCHPFSDIVWYRTTFPAEPAKLGQRTFLVFGGVEWEAQVWLNGTPLGSHLGYSEPFRFDVTGLLKEKNTLAVRVIAGPMFGQPRDTEAIFPTPPAQDQRYLRDKTKSIRGFANSDVLCGSGFGIHREVFLESTGEACVTDIFARGKLEQQQAAVAVEIDAAAAKRLTLGIEILPENFEGRSYRTNAACDVPKGTGKQTIAVPMPEAKLWAPTVPSLYRCRVSLSDGRRLIDAKDVLFGYRSFTIVSKHHPRDGLPEGMFVLNGRPLYLRGTNIQGLNALWYWNERDRLVDTIFMIKAANFNAVRSDQHVCFAEVRELLDRLGVMSEQDNGQGTAPIHAEQLAQLPGCGTSLAGVLQQPGRGALVVRQRNVFRPHENNRGGIGRRSRTNHGAHQRLCHPKRTEMTIPDPDLPEAFWANVVHDFHAYYGWYADGGELWKLSKTYKPCRLITVGEYGAEALDGYETMAQHYPAHWPKTPPADTDALLGQVQVQKADPRQVAGFRGKRSQPAGDHVWDRRPGNLGEYIEASQNYQADLLAEYTTGLRLSPRAIGGYFQYRFIDVIPANWPKAIVSHDLRPKKAYYEMAQMNQPLVPLFQLSPDGKTMELWVANDLPERFEHCRLQWSVKIGTPLYVKMGTPLHGEKTVDVPGDKCRDGGKVDLSPIPPDTLTTTIELVLADRRENTFALPPGIFLKLWRDHDLVWTRSRFGRISIR